MGDVLLRLTGKSAYCYETWPVLFDKVLNHLHNRGKGLEKSFDICPKFILALSSNIL
jgi:hypothetical protein